mgnify:CR=1 FL=1
MNTSRWFGLLLIVILVLAGIHWYLNSRPDAYFNQYGTEASSTPLTSDQNAPTNKTQDANASNTKPTGKENKTNSNNLTVKNFMHTITIETNKGTIVFETYDADAPKTVKNFITLAEKGFYNNLIFHRVIKDFMIQGGDPLGTGMGGPGYKFEDELNSATESYKVGYVRGAVAMANSGPNTNGSQFFIMHKDMALPHNYSIFGKVVSGMDVIDAIAGTAVDGANKPISDVVMKKVAVKAK